MRLVRSLFAVCALVAAAPAAPAAEFLAPDQWEGLLEYWTVTGDSVVGASKEGLKFNTFLCSKTKYRDFDLSFRVRLKGEAGNSGVQIRSKIANPKTFAVGGPQADIGAGYWGSLYGELFGGMMREAPRDKVTPKLNKGEFNDYSIKCIGKHVTITVNGVTSVDEDFEKMPDEGIIAFQLHAGGPMEVTFERIAFKDLSAGTK